MQTIKIQQKTAQPFIDLAIDTIEKNKQALIFVNSKKSAEKSAEEISKKIKQETEECSQISEKILAALQKPTRQCERLAICTKKGIAFHHAGLHSKQKDTIEGAFRQGTIKIICCTPTLAAGLDLPAYRVIIKDLKRYAEYKGMTYIPVLEYQQMAGRAGRPKFDTNGEAIAIAATENEATAITDKYILGQPEEIYSKLAVEPVLRTYILSLIASETVSTPQEIEKFFSQTFWAHQYKNLEKLNSITQKVLEMLASWQFITKIANSYCATLTGKRVAQLYLDPLTAHTFIEALQKTGSAQLTPITWIQLATNTIEMKPLLKIKTKEYQQMQERLSAETPHLLQKEPDYYDAEYEDYLNAFKTTIMLNDWIEETDEEKLFEKYDIRPGETRTKLKTADWLLYSLAELAILQKQHHTIKEISKTRMRIQYGAKEELLPLLQLEGIGRIRARKLYNNKIKDIGDIRKTTIEQLTIILGKKTAEDAKKQAGENG